MLIGIGIKIVYSSDPRWSPGDWEDVHQLREKGNCIECHTSTEQFGTVSPEKNGITSLPTKYHTKQFRLYTHGRTKSHSSASCFSCHRKNSCNSCHNQMPDTHTSDFVNPTGRGKGMEMHIMIGRIRPSSCLICHNSFKNECTNCHTLQEVSPWQVKGQQQLKKWERIHRSENIETN